MTAARRAVLGLDTSGAHCAVAVLRDGTAAARLSAGMAKGQAEALMPMIEAALAEAGLRAADLDLIAVGTGPGNFTGVRIAVAAARGMALGLGRPAVGVGRLAALAAAEGARTGALRIAATCAAPRGEVAAQVFDVAPNAPPRPLCAPLQASVADLARALAPHAPKAAVGPGAAALAVLPGCLAGPEGDLPDPVWIARLGAADPDPHHPRPAPIYLRPADAAPSAEPSVVLLG